MDFIRRILHGGEPSFTPIPGQTTNEQTVSDNEGQPIQASNSLRLISKKRVFSVILEAPFVILYYIMNLIILLLTLVSPVCAIDGYYKKRHRRPTDPKSRLAILLESLNSESQRTLKQSITEGEEATFSFGSLYNLENGSLSQDMLQGSYTELLAACSDQCKFAVIYLHDSMLDNSMQYVNNVLCSVKFTTLIKKYQILLWFSDVTTSEGLQVANALKVRQFPFLGVLCLKAEKKIEVIGRMEGSIDRYAPNHLETILSKGYPRLIQIRQQRQNSALQRIIREQQDSRFEESLAVDRQRERDRQEQRAREVAQQEHESQRKQWLLWRRGQLRPEPSNGVDTCRVAIRLEGGGRIVRKFDASLPVEEIYAYVELYNEQLLDISRTVDSPPQGYQHQYSFLLTIPVPRKELDPSSTIREESGLYPSGNIVMETLG